MHTATPARDPEIDVWAQINADRCRRAAQEHHRRQQAQRVNHCVDAFLAREATAQHQAQQVAA